MFFSSTVVMLFFVSTVSSETVSKKSFWMLSDAVELSFFSPQQQKIRIKNVKIIFFIVSFNSTKQKTECCDST